MTKTVIIFLLLSFKLSSQSNIIGKVYYQNSDWTPVEGILINAKGSNGDYSKTNGDYRLIFPSFEIGHTIHPFIGENNIAIDVNGKKVELVNEKELEFVSIPQKPQKAPLNIIVCPKGARDIAARKYYGIIKTQIEEELDIRRKEIIELKKQLGLANDLVSEKERKLRAYQQINDSIKIYKEAFKIASINKDGAKKRIINYLKALDAGISIKEARKELSTQKAYNEAIKSIKSLEASIEEIDLQAENYKIELKLDEAFAQYDTISNILNKSTINPMLLYKNYVSIGTLAQEINLHNKAIKNFNLALNIIENYAKYDLGKALLLHELAINYANIEQKILSEKTLNKSLEICKSLDFSNPDAIILFAKNCSALGTIYIAQHKYLEAHNLFNKSLDALTPILEKHPLKTGYHIVFALNKKAILYQKAKKYELAEKNFKTALYLSNTLNQKHNNKFLTSEFETHFGLGQLYFAIGQHYKATESFHKAIFIAADLSIKNPNRYNLPYAEILNTLLVSNVMGDYLERPNREMIRSISLDGVEFIEELISIYPSSNIKVSEMKNMNQVIKFYYSNDSKPEKIDINTPSIAMILLQKERLMIEKSIKSINNPEEELRKRQLILQKTELVKERFPNYKLVDLQLKLCHMLIASISLKSGHYDLAISSAEKAYELDKSKGSFGYRNLILVNAYVLQNKLEKAWKIYKKYKNELFPDSNELYKESFIADINDLEKSGIYHPEFKKIKEFLLK